MGSGSGFCNSPIYVFDVRVLYEEGGGGLHDHFSGSQCARHRCAPGRCSRSQAAYGANQATRPDLVAALSQKSNSTTREKTPSRARVVSSAPKGDVYSSMHKMRAVRAKFQVLDEGNNLQTSYL